MNPTTGLLALLTLALVPGRSAGQEAGACREAETTAGIRQCLAEALRLSEARLGDSLALARRVAQDSALLDSAQATWVRFVHLDCRAAADVYRGGSLAQVVYLACRLGHARRRLLDLTGDYFADEAQPGRREPR